LRAADACRTPEKYSLKVDLGYPLSSKEDLEKLEKKIAFEADSPAAAIFVKENRLRLVN
jgi:hypothetical protein